MKSSQKEKKPIHTFNELKVEERNHILRIYDFLTYSLRAEIKKRPLEFLALFFGVLLLSMITSGIIISVITGGISIRYSPPNFTFPTLSLPNFATGTQIITGSSRYNLKYDPYLLLEKIKQGDTDYALVDIRSSSDYELGHIKSAINIPVYGTKLIKKDGSLDKNLIKKAVKDKTKGKNIVIFYGHSQHTTYVDEIAQIVGGGKALAIGWNEWAHFKNLWVPESKWNEIDLSDYVQIKEE